MKKQIFISTVGLLTLFVFLAGITASASAVTIVGTVTDDYQIVTDSGDAYDVGEGEKDDAVLEHVDRKVKVTGELEQQDDRKIIHVEDFEVLD